MMGVSLAAAAAPPGSYRSFWKQLFPDVFNSFLKQALLIHRDQSLGCKLARKEEQLFSKDFFLWQKRCGGHKAHSENYKAELQQQHIHLVSE